MTRTTRLPRLRTLVGSALWAAFLGACSLNPQPLPPDTADGAAAGPTDAKLAAADGGQVDSPAGSADEGGVGLESGADAPIEEGGTTDALEDGPSDAATEASPEAGPPDGGIDDAADGADAAEAEVP